MNKIILIGNLTKDPELQIVGKDKEICKLTLAVTRAFSKETITDFFNITVWGKLAVNADKYLRKGSKIAVVGRAEQKTYENEAAEKKTYLEIIAEELEFLSNYGENTKEN